MDRGLVDGELILFMVLGPSFRVWLLLAKIWISRIFNNPLLGSRCIKTLMVVGGKVVDLMSMQLYVEWVLVRLRKPLGRC